MAPVDPAQERERWDAVVVDPRSAFLPGHGAMRAFEDKAAGPAKDQPRFIRTDAAASLVKNPQIPVFSPSLTFSDSRWYRLDLCPTSANGAKTRFRCSPGNAKEAQNGLAKRFVPVARSFVGTPASDL
jgi:hypothetical protein